MPTNTPYAPAPAAAPTPVHTDQLDIAGELLALLRDARTEPRPDPQLEALTLAVAADLPVLLWGEPGIGKTAALTQLAASLDLPLTTVIASVHEPSDFSGLPVVGDDPAEQGIPMAPPDWAVRLVRAGRGLLFLDELSTATPAVQAALLRLVLERRVGALRLPPGVRIVAAANPRASAADGWELSPPLANRFVHLRWTHDHEVVVRGLGGTWPRATLPRLDPTKLPEAVDFARRAVCGLLAARPALVHRLPSGETQRGGAWPSPRSWEMTLQLIAFATAAGSARDVLSLLVRGTVGDGPGLELLAALDRMDLPDPEVLLAAPDDADLPERGDLRQAALDGVVAAVRARPAKSRWDAAWTLLVRAMETGAPDLVVVPATALAALREGEWDVPASIERLAGAVSLSRRADRAAARVAVAEKATR
ncbi:ATPase family protein [Streptomyces venezuelae]|uniref:AAA family ATPase n=1 Tax=Streptomyces gardneri TaxID=66892 RepID=UPI0006BC7DC3|nr:MoxR family ATPase [Streptomyces gardneri]ALO06394.1 ATPase family protein [Streptomyces venezuelae]QPK43839.1 AAA family ATPase [Streptomyces gardneri]WRK35096.1 MoxR family ATPase [Streptomyces venezuelae]CUM43345.1 MoxR-like ATPases [Streptomyces venezuelae]